MFSNRNENTGRHEPTVSHSAWFFQARRYHARAQNQVVNKDEGILQSGANMTDDEKRLVAASRFGSISYFRAISPCLKTEKK